MAGSSALVSDPIDGRALRSLSEPVRGAVDVEDSEECSGASLIVGEDVSVVVSVDASVYERVVGTLSLIVGDSGSMACFSCIEDTILSRSSGGRRLSLHLLEDSVEGSGFCFEGEIVTSEEESRDEAWVEASEAKVEALEESSGTSFRNGLAFETFIVDVAMDRDALGLLHSVCRLIVRHNMFSSRLPSPRHSAWLLFEKTGVCISGGP